MSEKNLNTIDSYVKSWDELQNICSVYIHLSEYMKYVIVFGCRWSYKKEISPEHFKMFIAFDRCQRSLLGQVSMHRYPLFHLICYIYFLC